MNPPSSRSLFALFNRLTRRTHLEAVRLSWRSISYQLISLLLIYGLLLQLVPRVAIAARPEPPKSSPAASVALEGEKTSSTIGSYLSQATGAIESFFALEPVTSAPLPVPTPTPANGTAIVRHAPLLNGSGRVEGSLRQLTGESVTLNGGAVITNDLQVPGTPTLLVNGTPTFGGTIQGTGSAQPTNYQVTLNGTSSTVLGHLVTRTDPISLTNVAAPPASTGTRSVTITAAGQSAGNFATLRDLTLNGNVGMYAVPPGTYRNFIANAGSGFTLGVSGATLPAIYKMNSLTLNGSAQFQVIGPIVLTLGNALTVNAAMGSSSNPIWLNLQIASGGLTLNSGSLLNAVVKAPASTVIINASSQLTGTLTCDRLTINGGGLLRLTESALPPVNQAPAVNSGGNQTITLPNGVSLNGSATDDGLPSGSTLTTTWSKVSGPGTVNFANANNAVTTASFSQAGTYVLRLTASDSQLTNFSDATITVLPQNFPPTVSAGPDRIITQPGSATLSGSASDDGLPSGSSLSLLWTKVSGPGTVTFTNPTAAVTNASFSLPGSYTLRLTASDSQLSNNDDVNVTVNAQNQAPNVNAGAEQSITLPAAAALQGTVTDDGLPTGSSVTVIWSKLSGPGTVTFSSPTSANTNATFSVAGDYTLRLTASDSALSSHADVVIHVAAQNHAPTVAAGAIQTITLPASASLNGSVSDDGLPAGSTVTTTWSKVSGPGTVTFGNANVTVTTATFSAAGSYVLSLTASDSDLSDHAEVTITVIAQNFAPTVNAGSEQIVTFPADANLNGSASDDGLPAGSTLTTTWTKVSGPGTVTFGNANAVATTASFSEAGTYGLRLTASDSDLSNFADVQIIVNAENHPPTVDAGALQTITLPNTASLNGSASDDGYPAGSSLTTVWSKVSGPGTVTFGDPHVTVTTAAFSEAGTYVLRLTASDSLLSNSSEVQIIVGAENLAPLVNAGSDLVITPACVASLSATVSDDGVPAGGTLTVSWSKVSGPGDVSFANPSATITTATFSAAGVYVLQLTATDSELVTSDDVMVTLTTPAVAPHYFGPTPYLSSQDSPFGGSTFSYFHLEDFEDHLLNTPGVSADAGGVTSVLSGPGGHDSVDGDDGAIDGTGEGGDSYITGNGAVGITFTFDANTLGQLPTYAGVVWTDGAGQVYFEAFDHDGVSMGLQGPFDLPDDVFGGTTAEDRFLGAVNPGGISKIRVLNTNGGMEIDHLQYGFNGNSSPIVNAGQDPNVVSPGSSVGLNGSVSDDGLPACSTLSWTWSLVSGPGPVTFSDEHAAQTTVTLGSAGSYVLRLTASDSELTGFDEVTITVGIADARGSDFWLMFPIASGSGDTLTLLIAGEIATTGTINAPGISFTQNFSVTPGTVTQVIVPSNVEQLSVNTVDNKGIHVTAQQEVTVYGLNQRTFQTDGYLGLPVDVLGTEYITLGYKNGGAMAGTLFSLVATANNTTVDITPSVDDHVMLNGVDTIVRKAGVPFKITLNQGQTYQLETGSNPGDLSGSIISASKPIGVFGGHQCVNIPTNFVACNHIVEQLPSIDKWGTNFLTLPLALRTGGDTFRFIASQDNTHISINGVVVATLNRGQLDERILTAPSNITADQPILVAQYSNSFFFDSTDGDPSMIIVPPSEQFLASYTVATPASGFPTNYINVVVPNAGLGTLVLDGSVVPTGSFIAIGATGYSGAQLPINIGSHTLNSPQPFGASIYGFASFDAYGYPAGMSLSPIALAGRTTLTPRTGFGLPGTETCLTATVRDQNNSLLTNSQVNFSVTGANTATGAVPTNTIGQARFCYNGANAGFDTIVATSSNGSDQATRYWQPPNQAPIVSAGPDQQGPVTVCIPQEIPLQGSVSDDGFPIGAAVSVKWTAISGPGPTNFTNSTSASGTASFTVAGTYVLRLTASDTLLTSSDDVQVIVDPAPVNQPPTVSAGPAQTISMGTNLIQNPSNEKPLVNGEIPDWSEVASESWTQAAAGTSNLPPSVGGATYFYTQSNGPAPTSVLSQDVDISSLPSPGNFVFKGYLRVREGVPSASATVTLELINKNRNVSLGELSFTPVTTSSAWQLVEANVPIPAGAAWVRLRLHSTGPAGENGAGLFDALSLRFASNAATTRLQGTITDDGLYCGFFQQHWEKVSGPGAVGFSDPAFAVTNVSFESPGDYVLRFTGDDFYLTSSSEVTITVSEAATNQAPVVSAGANQTITLPVNAVSLNGTVTDDGLPEGINLTQSWSKVSGPALGIVTFANASAASTTASFSAAGTYVLRLTGDDSELSATDDVTIVVNPEATAVNQPPVVNPGPNQTISLPTDTVTLNGTATDDGLPVGNTLTVTWTQIGGPGTVIFGNANSAVTTAQLSATGTYVLRLSATDGAYTISADVGVTLTPQNFGPTANAGSDQTVLVSHGAQLDGSASDDGLPTGNLTTTWTKVSGPGNVTFLNSNVTITGAQFSATGEYVLRLTASDGDLSASDEITITVIDDVAPPTLEITAPADGSSVTEPTLVTGSVSGGAWVLDYSLASDDNPANRVWTQFASGNGAISNGTLGYLDPTMMLNGLFDIRLSATDVYGQTSRTWIAVVVERNLKVGNFTVSFSDLNIPVAGVPMEVTRTYDTRDKRVGDFGFGWTLGLKNIRVEKARVIGFKWFETRSNEAFPTYCLEATGSHLVTVTFPGGKVFKFEASVSPHCQQVEAIDGGHVTFTALPGTRGTLEIVGPNEFQVAGSIPGPVELVGFGGGVDIFNSSLFKYTAEDGTSFVIDQATGLQTIQDTNNNTVTVSAGGIIHSNGKSITFNRDSLGRITSVIDPAGNAQTYTYDAAGDLVSYTDNENNTSTYTYDANHRLLTIHDPRGIQPIRNDYDADGRLISHTDGFGKVITYTHDLPARTETITDRLGHPTVFEYDERGNVLRKTDARSGVTSFTYDDNDNVLTETNALGKTTTYTYDANDHRTSITDPLGNLTQFTYNGLGKVLTVTDPLGHVTTNTYNGAGNLLTTKDALDNTTTFTYSPFDGQRILMTDALNNSTHYDYTAGYLSKVTDALGNETRFFYDASGNRVNQLVKRTNAQGQIENIATDFEYDKLNRLTKTTFADGTFTRVEYNSIGQQAATIDQLGARTEFIYDDMGRLTKTTYPDGTHEDTTYDAEGRRLTSKDRAGRVTSFTYDELGRLTKTTFPDGTFTSTAYDAAGQVLTTTDARGNITHYFYDNAGRRSKVRNTLNQETTFAYDAAGNQLSMTDALGHTTSYEYDLNNRRVKTIYADATFDSVAYDAVGRNVSKMDQAGKTTQFVYDLVGRLTKVKDALNQETTYGYNELGQQVSQTDANNHTTRFEYDQLGRRVKRILPAGQFETYIYNNGGNLQSKTDFNGKTTTFNYDVMRRLLSKVPDASLTQPTVSFTYNTSGQRASMSDASGTTIYDYDVRNRLSSRQTPFGTLSYTYNDAGSLLTTRSSNANGVSVDYSYDSLNRLASVKDNNLVALNGGVTNYTYDNVGNLESYSYPNGVTSSYAYNSLNRLTTMTVGTTGSSLASYTYTLGAAGNRTAVTELSGRTVNYTYDDLYRLTNEAIANDPHGVNGSVSYGDDPVGNRLNRTSSLAPVPSQSSSYDANDRLTSDNYDNNGNTTSAHSNTYAYDFENHLTNLNGGSVGYLYDGDGNRVAKTVSGVTTNYLVDTNSPSGYAQVVDELQSGAVVKSYTYGHDLISQRIIGGPLSFYGYDGHGSVRLLTDATAAITDTYDYDAFGNLISRTGTTPNDYLYSGEQLDANLGFYYLRARYLDPSSGRFRTSDTYEGNSSEPSSAHKYLYADGDPANRIDPSGYMSIAESIVVVSIATIVITMPACQRSSRLIPRSHFVNFKWQITPDAWSYSTSSMFDGGEIEEIKLTAVEVFKQAYQGFGVTVTNDGNYTNDILFQNQSPDDPLGTSGATWDLNRSWIYLLPARSHWSSAAYEAKMNPSRAEVVRGIGTALGHTASHEFFHQLSSEANQYTGHSDNVNDIMWGSSPGAPQVRWTAPYWFGEQHWREQDKAVLRSVLPHD